MTTTLMTSYVHSSDHQRTSIIELCYELDNGYFTRIYRDLSADEFMALKDNGDLNRYPHDYPHGLKEGCNYFKKHLAQVFLLFNDMQ